MFVIPLGLSKQIKLITMDLDKVNPILGYEMYSKRDRADMNKRTAYDAEYSATAKNLSRLLGLSDKSDKNGNR